MPTALRTMVQDSDQASRRAELADFCGPNAESFLRAYDQLRQRINKTPDALKGYRRLNANFTPAAFFAGPIWFFYRKLWWWGAGYTLAAYLVDLVPGRVLSMALGLGMTFAAKRIYLGHAAKQLEALRAEGALTHDRVHAAGGVSKAAAWTGGALVALIFVLSIAILCTSPTGAVAR